MSAGGCRQPFRISKPQIPFSQHLRQSTPQSKNIRIVFSLYLRASPTMVFHIKPMQYFQMQSPRSMCVLGAVLMAYCGLRLWLSVRKRTRRLEEARHMNKEACDSFIRRYGPPDCGSVVWALYGRARQDPRKEFRVRNPMIIAEELQRCREVVYIVVSLGRKLTAKEDAH